MRGYAREGFKIELAEKPKKMRVRGNQAPIPIFADVIEGAGNVVTCCVILTCSNELVPMRYFGLTQCPLCLTKPQMVKHHHGTGLILLGPNAVKETNSLFRL